MSHESGLESLPEPIESEASYTPLSPKSRPDPNEDGLNHINCYSRGKTQLGRELSNFSHVPFKHPDFGFFASLEAYWYWIKTGCKHDKLRRLYGSTAKSAGIRLLPVMIDDAVFKSMVCDGIKLKIMQNSKLRDAVRKSVLPFRHYYVANAGGKIVNEPPKHRWQMECLEEIRERLKNNEPILLSDGRNASGVTIREVPENPTPDDVQKPVAEED